MKRTSQSTRDPRDYGYPIADIAVLSAKAVEVTKRLTQLYGELPFSSKDPMSMLVEILLSHRTYDAQTDAAYENLLKHFGSWEAVRDAPTPEVQETIANVNFPEVKAPRIQAVLRQITQERGSLNLDFLRDLPLEESVAWLNRFEGVGPKTTACVLLFSCQRPILPVDAHVARTSIRLGLIGKRVSAETAHTLLQALLPQDARSIYDFHKALLRHGQRICVFERPRCKQCVLTDICDYYKTLTSQAKQ
ncbi:endonuclease III [Ktedonobacter sp. SOSP1-52]|uniref:endonuclease III domain-containing protein n=1 Tax=Ktedonobacter sp. SOSP1-52 TaxID=2778366 RepID=UPI001916A035|nr:endonuclease III [Ktedonobacter sp. SOSP1-52]GHO67358.1 endonuclease III [Ktedonobacter sp. SOSP1-52]